MRHLRVSLDTLNAAADRRVYEAAVASKTSLWETVHAHRNFVERVWERHEGFYATLELAGPSLIGSYAARCLWEAAGHADKATRAAELELEAMRAKRARAA